MRTREELSSWLAVMFSIAVTKRDSGWTEVCGGYRWWASKTPNQSDAAYARGSHACMFISVND